MAFHFPSKLIVISWVNPLSFTVLLTNFLTYTAVVLLVFQDFWSLQEWQERDRWVGGQTGRDKERGRKAARQRVREVDRCITRFPGSSSTFQSHITQPKSPKSLRTMLTIWTFTTYCAYKWRTHTLTTYCTVPTSDVHAHSPRIALCPLVTYTHSPRTAPCPLVMYTHTHHVLHHAHQWCTHTAFVVALSVAEVCQFIHHLRN